MKTLAIWADGTLVPEGAPAVAATDLAFTRGYALFETARVTGGGTIVEHERHLQRLLESAGALRFPPVDRKTIDDGVAAVLPFVPPEGARLRYTVTGSGSCVVELSELPPDRVTVRAVTASWPVNELSPLTAHKLTSYAENMWAIAEARAAGADEALFRNLRGDYCEGTMSNLFIVSGGRLITPPLDAGILPGVTRAVIMERAGEAGIVVVEERVTPEAIFAAGEVMVTGSVKGVVPVIELDGRRFEVGPVTRRLQELMAG
ncbi:MAG TPA: aminotransferase class IV [Actinomycetaceae bacterium]|nr:aminotransferase class IV [Actinomycetaceae bacterium]